MYHHVDADTPRSTSVTPERFEAHLDYLEREDFNVLALTRVLDAFASGEALPPRTVAITFDDGYASVKSEAAPRLRARGWPFTVFVSTDYVGTAGYLDWSDLRELARRGASIGNHTRSHAHLVRRLDDESEADWRAWIRDEIHSAQRRIETETGAAAIDVLAYPYGEFDADVLAIVEALGLRGVGQHSGAVGSSTSLLSVPRFPLAAGFDSDEDFELRVNTRALPATPVGTVPYVVERPGLKPQLSLALAEGDYRAAELACYATGQGKMALERRDGNARLIKIRPVEGLSPGRAKFNCTAPSASEPGVYYWFGHQVMTRTADDGWYRE